VFNIARSVGYDKPAPPAQSGLGFMVLPTKEGKPQAALLYGMAF
jgi:hypothetical protein